MVKFADKGRPLKPASRIAIGFFVIVTVFFIKSLIQSLFSWMPTGYDWTLICPLLVTAAASALALHLVYLNWRELVTSVLISVFFLQLLEAATTLEFFLSWFGISGGVYILSVVDRRIREQELDLPKNRLMIILGLMLTAIALLIDLLLVSERTGIQFFGLGALVLAAGTALILFVAGYFLTLLKKTYWGILSGTTGLIAVLSMYLMWLILGSPWFP